MWIKGNTFKPDIILINLTIVFYFQEELGCSVVDLRNPKHSGMLITCAIDDSDFKYMRAKGLIEFK